MVYGERIREAGVREVGRIGVIKVGSVVILIIIWI